MCIAAENFSLTHGGPIYRLQARLGAADEHKVLVVRRACVIALVTWLPLLLLSAAQGLALDGHVRIPFLEDFAANVRFLIALPILVTSEVSVDRRLRHIVNHFLRSGIVTEASLPAFEAVIERHTRLRDRVSPEIVMLLLAYMPLLAFNGNELLMGNVSSWHSTPTSPGGWLTAAGWWFSLISAPLYRLLLLRWIWRMYLWTAFLYRVSKIDLALIPTHPDRAAGLGFLSAGQLRFGPIAFAMGAVLAGQLGNRIAYAGASISGLKYVIAAYCVCASLVLAAPLLIFAPTLAAVRRRGLREYGVLATSYAKQFDSKWIHGAPPAGETLLGSADIQSLADLGNSYSIVSDMRPIPLDRRTMLGLAFAAVLPMLPVLIFGTPADQLIGTLVKLLS